jgi:hypothetical protein
MEKKKKFFFSKEENVVEHIEKIDEKQMAGLIGGLMAYKSWKETPPPTYSESTYVRS